MLRIAGFRLYFYSFEPNERPHVHVDRGGASAKIRLEEIALAGNAGFSAKQLSNVVRSVRAYQLLEAWHEFIGTAGNG